MRGKEELPTRGKSKEREKYYLCPYHFEVMKGSKKNSGRRNAKAEQRQGETPDAPVRRDQRHVMAIKPPDSDDLRSSWISLCKGK